MYPFRNLEASEEPLDLLVWIGDARRMTTRHGFLFGLALGLMFSLGFGAATLLTPRASAQTGAQRWDGLRIDHGWDDGRWAREAGAQGWELVAVDFNEHSSNRGMYFKRPVR